MYKVPTRGVSADRITEVEVPSNTNKTGNFSYGILSSNDTRATITSHNMRLRAQWGACGPEIIVVDLCSLRAKLAHVQCLDFYSMSSA